MSAVQIKQPVTIPSPHQSAGRGPSLVAVLTTSAVSSPGVIVNTVAANV